MSYFFYSKGDFMNYSKTKNTKRFSFQVNRNTTAKKAGSNTVTISTRGTDGRYSAGQSQLTLTVREASALKSFLDSNLITV